MVINKNMSITRVLVTGGAGYVGAVLVPKLLNGGYEVTVLDWYIYGNDVFGKWHGYRRLKEVKGDLRDGKLLKKLLPGMDAVIHLACISNDPSFELDPNLGKTVNYDATVRLVDLSKKFGIKRFIYASTSSVYGIKENKEVTEDLSLSPLTDYSKYKALSEKYLLVHQSDDFTVLILRPATVCGYSPRMRLDLTVNILTIQALINKKITVYGGNQKRPNIHIEDMTNLYAKTLKYPKEKIAGKIFNAGYENYSVSQIAKMVMAVLHDPQISIINLPSDDKRSYHISSKKIFKELGFKARHSVKEAIRDIKAAYELGYLENALTDPKYINIKTMKSLDGKFKIS